LEIMGIFISLFNRHTSGTINVTFGKLKLECDVKHNMATYGRQFWWERSPKGDPYFYFIFFVPLYWIGLRFTFVIKDRDDDI
jgi:hypothetical protein